MWRIDVSWSLAAIGDVLERCGDGAGALAAFREALAIRRELSAGE